MTGLCFKLGVLCHIQHQLVERDRYARDRLLAILDAGQSKESSDQFIETADFELDAVEHISALSTGPLAHQSQSDIQTRKR